MPFCSACFQLKVNLFKSVYFNFKIELKFFDDFWTSFPEYIIRVKCTKYGKRLKGTNKTGHHRLMSFLGATITHEGAPGAFWPKSTELPEKLMII